MLRKLSHRPHRPGTLFRAFLAAYLAWRLCIDFLKPQPHLAGMNVIQWACIAGLLALAAGELTHAHEASSMTSALDGPTK